MDEKPGRIGKTGDYALSSMTNFAERVQGLQCFACVIHGGNAQIGATQVHSNGERSHGPPPGAQSSKVWSAANPGNIIANRFNKTTAIIALAAARQLLNGFTKKMRE